MIRALLLAGVLSAVGLACGIGVEDCGTMEWWVKKLARDNPSATGWLKVRSVDNIQEVSKSDTRVHCLGLANMENGAVFPVEFYSYVAPDGDVKVGYNVLE